MKGLMKGPVLHILIFLIVNVGFLMESRLSAQRNNRESGSVKAVVTDNVLMVIGSGGHGSKELGGQSPYNSIPLEEQVKIMKYVGLGCERGWAEFDTVGVAKKYTQMWDYFYEHGIDNLAILNPIPQVLRCTNATEAYAYGFTLGNEAAGVGKNHHVKYWDCGNEFGGIARNKWPDDYDQRKLEKCIAMQKGLIDGIRAADPNAKCMISDFRNIAYHKAAWDAGLRWDITGIHEYTPYTAEGFNDNSIIDPLNNKFPSNSLQYCNDHFNGLPIWITEFNENGGQGTNDSTHAQFFKKALDRYKSVAETYNLQRIFIYEFYKQPGLVVYEAEAGIVKPDGKLTQAADSIKAWIKRNPPFLPKQNK